MVHKAANILTEEQYLQIVNEASTPSDNSSNEYNVETPVLESVLFDNVSPLYYKSKVRLSFSLSKEFKRHFVLIKGLIEFHRSKNFSFEYNVAQKRIEADIEVSELNNLQIFFESVLRWLNEELKFKETLKVILEFEHRYRLEQAEIYSLLRE